MRFGVPPSYVKWEKEKQKGPPVNGILVVDPIFVKAEIRIRLFVGPGPKPVNLRQDLKSYEVGG